jgi:hypothetical protein
MEEESCGSLSLRLCGILDDDGAIDGFWPLFDTVVNYTNVVMDLSVGSLSLGSFSFRRIYLL